MVLNADTLNRTVFVTNNLPFLKALDTGSVDLVVIDPPFGKKQTFTGKLKSPLTDAELEQEYNLLSEWGIQNENDAYEMGLEFPDQSGTTATFRDIWDFRYQVTQDEWEELDAMCRPARLLIEATRYTHSDSVAAYIAFMTMRMLEIRRVLKDTGSVYLHCDHEANAYLRQMMDAVFGQTKFRNEITWERTRGRSDGRHWGNTTDTLLFYVKSENYFWQNVYQERLTDTEQTTIGDLTGPDIRTGISGRPWRGYNPTEFGRHWAVPRNNRLASWIDDNRIPGYLQIDNPHERLDALNAAGMVIWSDNGRPSIIRPAEVSKGAKVNNLWRDITRTSNKERTGYPTQKPQALARRIIEASSNPGDLVLDCFAGCAYVPVAAELTGRRWIACDMSPRAWTVVRRQFHKQPNLRIVTEGEYTERYGGIQPDLGTERIIRVRGPHDLPERTTNGQQKSLGVRDKPPIQFRERAVEDAHTIWTAFVAQWGLGCWYCGIKKQHSHRELQLDHVEPNKRDGSNDDCWNRALSCIDCNGDKGNRLTPEQTIAEALSKGRIATPALHDEQLAAFKHRRQWTIKRWEIVKPRKLAL